MKFPGKTLLQARKSMRGQTMTEYAMILSAIAVVVYLGYSTMGSTLIGLLTAVTNQL